jgi:poly(hydroxyalkanoate) granule-associated protein
MAKSTITTRKKNSSTAPSDSNTLPAQHVWLAGLGAMAKAQEQGSKAIETLLNDGLAFQRKSQAEAQQRLQEATERLNHMASDLGQHAAGRMDKLEHLFEDRVAKALHRLGMPTLLDIQMLNDRVAQLEAQLAAMTLSPAKTPASVRRTRTKATPTKTVSTPATSARNSQRARKSA